MSRQIYTTNNTNVVGSMHWTKDTIMQGPLQVDDIIVNDSSLVERLAKIEEQLLIVRSDLPL